MKDTMQIAQDLLHEELLTIEAADIEDAWLTHRIGYAAALRDLLEYHERLATYNANKETIKDRR